MTTWFRAILRAVYASTAALLVASVVLPLLSSGQAFAAQLTSRSITLSDSGASGNATITSGEGSGTGVTYEISFTTGATQATAASSMIIDFCSNDPIIGDSCTAPTGLNASSAAIGTTAAGTVTSAGWSVTAGTSQIKLAKATGTAIAGSGTTETFTLTGITNPSTVGTFYGRMYTFQNSSWGTYSNAGTPGNYLDYGGVALSTANVITITARVQEQLTFCVSGAAQSTWTTSHNCSDPNAATAPAITLGHGTPPILDSSAVDTGSAYSQVSTNATHGVAINMVNSNQTCTDTGGGTGGGLSADFGSTCAIPPINGGSGAGASAMTAGSAAFGLFVPQSSDDAGVTGSTGSVAPTADYYNGSHNTFPTKVYYGMDNSTSGNNVSSTFGRTVASSATPVYGVDNTYDFAATASLTTPAGIYTGNMALIATGTF